MSKAEEQLRLALHAYHTDPLLHAKVENAMQVMHLLHWELKHDEMPRDEELVAQVAAALALHVQGGDKTYRRVVQVMTLTGEEHATKSRDFGRGFQHCLELVKGYLSGEYDEPDPLPPLPPLRLAMLDLDRVPPRRQPKVCMIPDCGCTGEAHP